MENEHDAFIPEYTPEFEIEQFDLRNVFAYAQAAQKTAYDVLKERHYPVFKMFTGGDGIAGVPVAGDKIEAFRFNEASELFEPIPKAAVSEENPSITLTASSTAVDLVGDVMEESALQDMVAAAKGMTVFLNHQYRLPEDVFGTVVDASLERRQLTNPLTQETANYLCLDYKVRPVSQEENPRAWQVYKMLANAKMRLGASVTVLMLEKADSPNGRRLIKKVFLIETSLVGIPANQLSWVRRAAKALKPAQRIVDQAQIAPTERKSAMSKQESTPPAAPAEAEVANKGMYADKVKERTNRFYFMVETLADVISTLKSAAGRKMQMDYPAELAEALAEFSAACTEAILPALTNPSSDGYSYYSLFDPRTGQFAIESITQKIFAGMSADDIEIAQKAGARNNKDDLKRIQGMHDMCCELGAKCMEKSAETDQGTKAAPIAAVSSETDSVPASHAFEIGEFETKVASLQGEITTKDAKIAELEKANKDLQEESNQWRACSFAAAAVTEKVLDAPMPRAGQSV